MSIVIDGGNLRVTKTVRGHVFPRQEAEIVYPVLVDATADGEPISIEGSLYGRSLRLIGAVDVTGPVVARGDLTIEPAGKQLAFYSGLNASDGISVKLSAGQPTLQEDMENASVVVRGDVVAKNVYLENAIVFGSIRAVNCNLRNCVILGTAAGTDSLTITTSTLAGYMAREVVFEGPCMMIHSIGESASKPVFSVAEQADGTLQPSDVRFYPSVRESFGMLNKLAPAYPAQSQLNVVADWVKVGKETYDGGGPQIRDRWVLSIGGRICDVRYIKKSIELMSHMLKTGFEYDHYLPNDQPRILANALTGLNADEAWILRKICKA